MPANEKLRTAFGGRPQATRSVAVTWLSIAVELPAGLRAFAQSPPAPLISQTGSPDWAKRNSALRSLCL